ncbi:MAG: sodium-dependent transporter [Gammaproteobacteria bacterium]|nr:sodium-dependent transporter [Gammaproteobacteria bacterium]MDG1951516.1 sodium-dependent transporter [Gammaproteobacteria bacterium]
MTNSRGEFSSRFGFLMAASGSAVGLGNIWGFPTNAASNGGAAFLFTYLLLALVLAYPALMAELIIGRHSRSNAVTALQLISVGEKSKLLGFLVGFLGIVTVTFILSFYAVVSGWMFALFIEPIARFFGWISVASWLEFDSTERNVIALVLFMVLTISIINAGVQNGIEKWARRLMPALITILIALSLYVFTLPGALVGLQAYLIPDFTRVASAELLVDAMGQAFFSLSLGVGTMLVYGSYLSKEENLPMIGGLVALLDVGIAVLAGLLILPAMYVALESGVEIFDSQGNLIAGPRLIVSVLPNLFGTMGSVGLFVAFSFFALMTIASLTSSISMLEVPVSYAVEELNFSRSRASVSIGGFVTIMSILIAMNFDWLFDVVVTLTTELSQPLLGLFFCIFVGWIWRRDAILEEIRCGSPNVQNSIFWKIWPFYVKFICPLAILIVYLQ